MLQLQYGFIKGPLRPVKCCSGYRMKSIDIQTWSGACGVGRQTKPGQTEYQVIVRLETTNSDELIPLGRNKMVAEAHLAARTAFLLSAVAGMLNRSALFCSLWLNKMVYINTCGPKEHYGMCLIVILHQTLFNIIQQLWKAQIFNVKAFKSKYLNM